jgi:steroid 5-alpha reductase family enzyme
MKKFWSLMVIVVFYAAAVLAAALVVYFCNKYIANDILLIFTADLCATVVVFIASIIVKNASVYDPYWSAAPPFIVWGFYYAGGAAFTAAHVAVLIPLAIWAVRLTYNWAKGFESLTWQDWRYIKYKQQFPHIYLLINFTGIMLMPTVLVFAGCVPLYYLITGTAHTAALLCGGGIVLFAAIYQMTADYQLAQFRRNPKNKGKCIDCGLWRLSRHPNYFGEISIWFGVFIASLPNVSWLSPLGCTAILCLFVFVSVPLMENRMLENYPDYAAYKTRVPSTLFPLPRKK